MQSVYNESEHVIVGPGAEEGLSWLYEDMGSLSSVDGVHHLVKIQHEYFDKLGVTDQQLVQLFGEYPRPPSHADQPKAAAAQGQRFQALNLMDVENCLCEGNKYFRVRFQDGSGDPKRPCSFFLSFSLDNVVLTACCLCRPLQAKIQGEKRGGPSLPSRPRRDDAGAPRELGQPHRPRAAAVDYCEA